MSIFFPKRKKFLVASEDQHQAVFCDIVPLGLVKTTFGPKQMVKIVWEIKEVNPETNKRFTVSQRYNFTMDERGDLRKLLDSIRTKKFTDEELEHFDLEQLIGVNVNVSVIHNIKAGGSVWANVKTAMPLKKGTPLLTVRDYVRVAGRQEEEGGEEEYGDDEAMKRANPFIAGDDDIPF